MLSLIASYLTTHPQTTAPSEALPLTSDAQRRSSGSGAIELRTDARLWEVQWPELTILHLVGRGSFGSVYLAEWNYTQVAVKVLVSKGECWACSGCELEAMWLRCCGANCRAI